jgi:hypothetical protein
MLGALVVPDLALAGPVSPPPPPRKKAVSTKTSEPATTKVSESEVSQALDRAAAALEKLRSQLEEWGAVTVSEPLLLPVKDQFKLGEPAEFPNAAAYIAAERTNVSASVSALAQRVFTARGGLAASLTPPVIGSSTAASAPAIPETPTLTIDDFAAQQYLDNERFRELGGLLGTAPNGIPERQAVLQGTSDKISEILMRTLANPPTPADGRKLYLMLFQVTCNPGWRTDERYVADLKVTMEYGKRNGADQWTMSLSDGTNAQPNVIAVLPLLDAQNMELRNGQRELTGLLAALSVSGAVPQGSAAGKGLAEYLNSFQKDGASRHAMPVVNSYTTSTTMGFRFAPSYLALKDPGKKKSREGNVLIPTSFPVLAVVAMDPREVGKGRKDEYTHLVTNFGHRWMLRDRRISLWPWDWSLPGKRETEQRRLQQADAADSAHRAYSYAKKALKVTLQIEKERTFNDLEVANESYLDSRFRLLRFDYHELEQRVGGRWAFSRLPADLTAPAPALAPPTVIGVQPVIVDPTIETRLTVQGANFGKGIVKVLLGGRECTPLSIDGDGTSLVVLTTPGHVNANVLGQAELVVVTKEGAGAFTVGVEVAAQARRASQMRRITLQRDGQGRVTALEFEESGSLSGTGVLEAIGRILAPPPEPTPPR